MCVCGGWEGELTSDSKWGRGAGLLVTCYSFQKVGEGGLKYPKPFPLHGPCILVKDKPEYSISNCPQLQTEVVMAKSSIPNKKR